MGVHPGKVVYFSYNLVHISSPLAWLIQIPLDVIYRELINALGSEIEIYRHQKYFLISCVCTLVSSISFARSVLSSFLPWQDPIYISKVQVKYESLFLLSQVSFIFNLCQTLSLALSHTETYTQRYAGAHSPPPPYGYHSHFPAVVSVFHCINSHPADLFINVSVSLLLSLCYSSLETNISCLLYAGQYIVSEWTNVPSLCFTATSRPNASWGLRIRKPLLWGSTVLSTFCVLHWLVLGYPEHIAFPGSKVH